MPKEALEITSKGKTICEDRPFSVSQGEKTTEQHVDGLAPSPSTFTTHMATDNPVKPSELQQFGELLSKNMLTMQQSMQPSFSRITDVLPRITEEGEIFDDDEERVVEKRPEEMAGDVPVPKKTKAQLECEDNTS